MVTQPQGILVFGILWRGRLALLPEKLAVASLQVVRFPEDVEFFSRKFVVGGLTSRFDGGGKDRQLIFHAEFSLVQIAHPILNRRLPLLTWRRA
jgi:hypothetical protein